MMFEDVSEYRNPSPPPDVEFQLSDLLVDDDQTEVVTVNDENDEEPEAVGVSEPPPSVEVKVKQEKPEQIVADYGTDSDSESASASESNSCCSSDNSGSEYDDYYENKENDRVDKYANGALDYFCDICKAQMNSEYTWSIHIHGKRHQKKLKMMKVLKNPDVKQELKDNITNVPPVPCSVILENETPLIQSRLDEIRAPVLGLSFITEIRYSNGGDPIYYCALCAIQCMIPAIFEHIIGTKHRMLYIKCADLIIHERLTKIFPQRSNFRSQLDYESNRLEKIDGRGQLHIRLDDSECSNLPLSINQAISVTEDTPVSKIMPSYLDSLPSSIQREIFRKTGNLASVTTELGEDILSLLHDISAFYDSSK